MPDWTALRDDLAHDVAAPSFDVVLGRARHLRRRRLAAAAGVVATALAVPAAIAIPLATSDGANAPSGPRPSVGAPTFTVITGGGPWHEAVWTDRDHGWAVARVCPPAGGVPKACPATVAHTDDGGATWKLTILPEDVTWALGEPFIVSGHRLRLGVVTSGDDGNTWAVAGQPPGGLGQLVRPGRAGHAPQTLAAVISSTRCLIDIKLRTFTDAANLGTTVATITSRPGTNEPLSGRGGVDGSVAFVHEHTQADTCGPATPGVLAVVDGAGQVSEHAVGDEGLAGLYDAQTMWFRSPEGALSVSHDGGVTRTPIAAHGASEVLPFSADRFLLARNDDQGFHLYLSTDGGQTSRLVLTDPESVGACAAAPVCPGTTSIIDATHAVYVKSDGTVLHSDDAGETWNVVGHLPTPAP